MKELINICWFRRDIRLKDNAALHHALKSKLPVVPIFIFDKNILGQLEQKADRRVQFIHDALTGIQSVLEKKGATLHVLYDTPKLLSTHLVQHIISARFLPIMIMNLTQGKGIKRLLNC